MPTLRPLFFLLLTLPLLAADPKPAPAPSSEVADIVATLGSIGGALESAAAPGSAVKAGRPWKQSVAIIAAGAAAGASIGAATRKGRQAMIIGAVAGAAAGLIYDRATAHPKPETSPSGPPPSPASPSEETALEPR